MSGTIFLSSTQGSAGVSGLSKRELYALKVETLTPEQEERVMELFFQEDFGAIADTERNRFTARELFYKTRDTILMNETIRYFPWEHPISIPLLAQSEFLMLPLECREFTHRGSPAIECYKNQYCTRGNCSALYHRVMAEQNIKCFDRQEIAYGEFLTKYLNPNHPLQDLRDRGLRVMTMEKERTLLSIWALYHQMQQKAIALVEVMKQSDPKTTVSIAPPGENKISYGNFVSCMSHTFSFRQILINGKIKDAEVVGLLPYKEIKGKKGLDAKMDIHTIISIRNCYTNELYGSMRFHKTWKVVDDDSFEIVTEESRSVPGSIIPFAIVVDDLYISTFKSEAGGDWPVIKMMAQIMIEVLLRENFNLLQIKSMNTFGGVFQASGFCGSSRDKAIIASLKNARNRGELFSSCVSVKEHTLEIYKSDATVSSTRLKTVSEEKMIPTYVQHALDGTSTTWEHIIEVSGPLLGTRIGPVLPTFNLRDLTPFEN